MKTRKRSTYKATWTQSHDPIEFRATIAGARCVVRRNPDFAALEPWELSIHRDTVPVEKSTHLTFWDARTHAERVLGAS